MSDGLREHDAPPPTQSWLAQRAELSPASFGKVMATGIVSLGTDQMALHAVAQARPAREPCVQAADELPRRAP
jgi:hypothetical protein